jgi:nicotinamidase-related amidase
MGVKCGRTTIIEAKPEPITVNCEEMAVIVVDMQNDFCSKGGLFDRAGINISAVQKAVAPTRKVLSAARDLRASLIFPIATRRLFSNSTKVSSDRFRDKA